MFLFDESLETFEIFSLSHLLGVLFWVTAITLMIVFRKKLRGMPRFDRFIRYFLAITMLTFQFTFYLWMFWRGAASLELLPFGLCHLAMYLTSLMLLTQSKTLFKIVFPWAIIGALLSLVIADLTFAFPHFRYIHYFGNHGMFLFGVLYMMIVRGYTISYKSLWMSGGVLIGLAVPVYFFNQAYGTNHLFLSHLPGPAASLQTAVGDWWIVLFVAFVFALFHLIYLAYVLISRHSKDIA
ncbi:MAG TPA: TIGR02206 family membrane protein [Acholeplasmatales bacterium]|nr:MAG: hypothetical protein A2Y16_01360 [Tenericutes bacterium GWF2_57_13]HAQ56491.1 TIGR02206 family membrane protein [Acholeplasmatales bacterium]